MVFSQGWDISIDEWRVERHFEGITRPTSREKPSSRRIQALYSPRRQGSWEKIVAPASRRHLSLDNSFWVNTTFAGWKPAIHFFSRPRSARRFHRGIRFSVPLRVLRDEAGRLADPGSPSWITV